MPRPLIAAALAATLIATPASAQPVGGSTTAEVFAAFKAVCLDHVGDTEAQIAAAQATPQGFTLLETDSDGTKVYVKGAISLNILPKPDQRYCMVISRVGAAPSFEEGASMLVKHLPATAQRTPSESDRARWNDRRGNVIDSYLFVLPDDGESKLVAFFAGREPGAAKRD